MTRDELIERAREYVGVGRAPDLSMLDLAVFALPLIAQARREALEEARRAVDIITTAVRPACCYRTKRDCVQEIAALQRAASTEQCPGSSEPDATRKSADSRKASDDAGSSPAPGATPPARDSTRNLFRFQEDMPSTPDGKMMVWDAWKAADLIEAAANARALARAAQMARERAAQYTSRGTHTTLLENLARDLDALVGQIEKPGTLPRGEEPATATTQQAASPAPTDADTLERAVVLLRQRDNWSDSDVADMESLVSDWREEDSARPPTRESILRDLLVEALERLHPDDLTYRIRAALDRAQQEEA